ncbi:S1/P1 nuclease [Stutzerimonas kirkiae]|uniref:S1/P1 nuclease n=1 Tax=Stutzerimonas kirkiae TaxID=2211392 RepID=A0A4V2KCP0_9GAMM|nr:S1/P1 nuclease [Stutzerimonas kirkiae]TBU95782.1 hypothetical protein DNJ96_11945 [Stutzerimonas kirkiae]TBV02773.1 hypothetical protein DNJ95_08845 [Stutzerimonas kirkiae]TBV03733.1 hypothetical protein DNK08_17760 [Stutzerimonas kirkiae]TBV13286.1 hypothetical protein DNK01_12585 [Stutzerimonas kirkiae]
MKANTSLHTGLLLVVGLWAGEAMAWGQQGTALVAELTQRQLAPQARAEATRLLGLIKQSELATVANWAGNLDKNPQTRELWEKTRDERRVPYQADDCQYQPPRDCPGGVCTVAAIERNQATLADPEAPDQARLMALLFLLQHVADIHSPLNNSFKDDQGGEGFPVRAGNRNYNLRQVWDDFLLSTAKLDIGAYADKLHKDLPAAGAASPAEWSQESCRIVRDADIYPKAVSTRKLPTRQYDDNDDGGIDYAAKNLEYNRTGKEYSRGDKLMNENTKRGNDTIDARYMKKFVPLAEQRVELAAARLARLLDQALTAGQPAR